MKQKLFLTILLLSLNFLLFAQAPEQKSIREILEKIEQSMKKHNMEPLEHIYASDFIFVSPAGQRFTKPERIANLKSQPAPEEFSFKNEKIRIYGNVALVNCEVAIKPAKDEATQDGWVSMVFVKKNGTWQEVSAQGTPKK